jgi:hypothetical protein
MGKVKACSEAPWIRTSGGDKKAKSAKFGATAKEQTVTSDSEHSPRLRLPLPSVCSTKEAAYESDSSQEVLRSPIIKRATFCEEENKYYELTNTQDDELKPKSKETSNLSFSRLVKGLPARDKTEPKRAPRQIRRKNRSRLESVDTTASRSSEPRPPDQVNAVKKGIEEDDVSDQGSWDSSYVEASQTDNCVNDASQDTVAHAKIVLKKHKAKDSPVLGEGVHVLLTRIELTEKENIKLKSKLQMLQGAFDKLKSECKERGRICNELSTELERYSETEERIQKECDRVSTPQPSVHRPSTRTPSIGKLAGDVQQRSGKKRKQKEADDDGTVLAKLDTVSRSLSDRKRKKRKSKKSTEKAVGIVNKSLRDNDLHTNKEQRNKRSASTSSKRTSPKRRSHQKGHHMGFSVSCQHRMCSFTKCIHVTLT